MGERHAANGSPLMIAPFPSRMENNPYGRLLYDGLSRSGFERADDARLELGWLLRSRREVTFLHFHWDEHFYESRCRRPRLRELLSWIKLAAFAVRLGVARAMGYRLVWTIHEIRPRETRSPQRDRIASWVLARSCHLLLAHDTPTADRARRHFSPAAAAIEVVPHGSYIGVYPPGRSRASVRADLGISDKAFAFLCFGHLRRYKRLDLLLEAFRRLDREDAALVIAGQVAWRVRDEAWERTTLLVLERAAAADPRIRLRIGFVPDYQVAELHGACDAAVLPRSDGWTSGSLLLALSQGLPVIAPRMPAYEALIGAEAAGWLFRPGDAASLATALSAAMSDRDEAEARGRVARRRAQRLDWAKISERTASLMRETLNYS
jgi:beta-1,4-mannosyltransferase